MAEAVDAERPQLLMAAEAYIKNVDSLKKKPVTLSAETPHVRVQLELDEHNLWHPAFFKQLTDEKLKLQDRVKTFLHDNLDYTGDIYAVPILADSSATATEDEIDLQKPYALYMVLDDEYEKSDILQNNQEQASMYLSACTAILVSAGTNRHVLLPRAAWKLLRGVHDKEDNFEDGEWWGAEFQSNEPPAVLTVANSKEHAWDMVVVSCDEYVKAVGYGDVRAVLRCLWRDGASVDLYKEMRKKSWWTYYDIIKPKIIDEVIPEFQNAKTQAYLLKGQDTDIMNSKKPVKGGSHKAKQKPKVDSDSSSEDEEARERTTTKQAATKKKGKAPVRRASDESDESDDEDVQVAAAAPHVEQPRHSVLNAINKRKQRGTASQSPAKKRVKTDDENVRSTIHTLARDYFAATSEEAKETAAKALYTAMSFPDSPSADSTYKSRLPLRLIPFIVAQAEVNNSV
jgi:hypothetical protein